MVSDTVAPGMNARGRTGDYADGRVAQGIRSSDLRCGTVASLVASLSPRFALCAPDGGNDGRLVGDA